MKEGEGGGVNNKFLKNFVSYMQYALCIKQINNIYKIM